jgi:translation initiation factor IF-3
MRYSFTFNNEIIEKIRQAVAVAERQTGRIPTIDQLAVELGIDANTIRRAIQTFLADGNIEGTSAFNASLLETLIDEQSHHRHSEVRLIDEDGTQLGIHSIKDALRIARERDLDLSLVHPEANPPVGHLINYGRHKFEMEKRKQSIKMRHHIVEQKELKMSYRIDAHDYQTKLHCAQKILHGGDKIKVQITMRGREIEHADMAIALMHRFAEDLENLATVDRPPRLDGKSVVIVLSPISPTKRPFR